MGRSVVYLKFMIKADVPCEHGDSGGLLYTKSGGKAYVVGILTARDPNGGPYTYFSNAGLLPWNISVIN